MPVDLTWPLILAVGAAAFLLGLSKAGLGGGLGPLITVLVSLFVPPARAIGVLLPLLIAGDVFAVWTHRRSWDRGLIVHLLPSAVVGVAIASFFLGQMSERGLQIFLAVLSLAFAAYRLAERRLSALDLRPGPAWGVVAGFTSGVTSTVAHSGGPPVVVYLLARRVPPVTYVATLAVFFAIVNWLTVPGYVVAGLIDASLLVRVAPF
ncbi:MAG TPA: sulfite exporter TauE/SafE family protein, partial [Euzebyales bacterium]|nr:sulfite exporter TauE/SafE family protein [Euzebyales bacterium]